MLLSTCKPGGWKGAPPQPPAEPQGKASVAGQTPVGRAEVQLALPSARPPTVPLGSTHPCVLHGARGRHL